MTRISLTIMTLVCAAAPAYAAFVAIESFDTSSLGETDNRTVGYDFTVSNQITVTHLGYFDEGGDGLSVEHEVGIWSTAGSLLAAVTVPAGIGEPLITPGGAPGGGYRYQQLGTSFSLNPGSYVIGGHFVSSSPLDRYPHDGVENIVTESNISLGGGRFSESTAGGFEFPAPSGKGDGAPVLSVNFMGDVIPEPSCIALALFGIPLLGLFRRIRLAA